MNRVNSDESYFLEKHEQEIINCCKKAMSNKEVIELLKTKYGREIPLTTYRKFKARLKLTKGDFLETLLDEIKVNVLMGVNPELGSSPMYENQGNYDGKNDPLFNEALDAIEQELNDKNKQWHSVKDFFKLQMAYMLLWSSIDRYCTLKYDGQSFGDYHRKLADEKVFKDALKKHVASKRTVYSAQDLREYTLKPEKSYYSLKYYYTIRCNVVHRGKAIHGDEHMLRASLTELLNIFKDVLDDTFNNGD